MPRLAAGLRRVAPAAASLLTDLVGVGGACLVSYGAWEVYRPAGLIVGGVLMMVIAVGLARR